MNTALRATSATFFLAWVSGAALAGNGQPSSKFSASSHDHVLIDSTTQQDWTPVMNTGIKLPNQKDLFIQTSMECGLYTQTAVADSATDTIEEETADRAYSEAVVRARVKVTDTRSGETVLAHPGEITLCGRSQQLTALFNGICYDQADDETGVPNGVVEYDECDRNEELDLAVKTLNASAFNFLLPDLSSGYHVVTVEAKIQTDTSTATCDASDPSVLSVTTDDCTDGGNGSATAQAIVGNGSLAIEEVRMVQGHTGVVDPNDGSDAFLDFSDLGE